MRLKIYPVLASTLALIACGESDLEKADFNVYFTDPDGKQESLGQVSGLSACRASANARADALQIDADWSYVCCRKTWMSDCASKHQ